MNKAFVKESEDHGDHCPACGSAGKTVFSPTLDAHLPEESRGLFSDSAFYCPHPTCEVAYFDRFERTVAADSLVHPVYPKDPDAPICPCFGLTCADIEADVRDETVTRIREHLKRAESEEARCTTMSASGQSCVAAVQKYFMWLRGQ